MNEPDYEAIVAEFIATRDATALRAEFEPHLRKSFEQYTCHQGGTDEFMEEFFQRLTTEPFPGGYPCNWLWRVFWAAAEKVKRVTPATVAALAVALENRDAILAIELSDELEELELHERDKIDFQLIAWFGDTNLIDFDLIADQLAA